MMMMTRIPCEVNTSISLSLSLPLSQNLLPKSSSRVLFEQLHKLSLVPFFFLPWLPSESLRSSAFLLPSFFLVLGLASHSLTHSLTQFDANAFLNTEAEQIDKRFDGTTSVVFRFFPPPSKSSSSSPLLCLQFRFVSQDVDEKGSEWRTGEHTSTRCVSVCL